MPELNRDELEAACFAVAKTMRWEKGPVDVASISTLAKQLERVADDSITYLQGQQHDPNIVTRAIRYIEHHHALPTRGHIDWFYYTLNTLVELVCPNTQPMKDSEQFYKDLKDGLSGTCLGLGDV